MKEKRFLDFSLLSYILTQPSSPHIGGSLSKEIGFQQTEQCLCGSTVTLDDGRFFLWVAGMGLSRRPLCGFQYRILSTGHYGVTIVPWKSPPFIEEDIL